MKRISSIAAALSLVCCTSTTLRVPANHVANPEAVAEPLPAAPTTLEPDFDPIIAYPSGKPAPGAGHGHMHHGGMKHGDMKHGDMKHGDMKHGDMKHGEAEEKKKDDKAAPKHEKDGHDHGGHH